VRAKSPTADVASPGTSSRCSADVSRVSVITSRATRMARTPTGTLMKKIQPQCKCSAMTPPTSGPMASASAETPAQIPIAIPRCRGGNVAVMIERVAGFIRAAPTPWTIRAPMSHSALGAMPHAREAAVKIASPTTKMSRRPRRSASFPPVSITTAKVSA
jgi:hypothetical protein